MKILLILDLDYTHFISHIPGTNWLGDKQKRLRVYLDLIEKAKLQNVEVIWAVVSSKYDYDDLCKEAAIFFKDLLQLSNPHMYTNIDDHEHLLIKICGRLLYKGIHTLTTSYVEDTEDKHSHFHLVSPAEEKITAMLEIGNRHDIPAERIIFLDDSQGLLNLAKQHGINTVSFNCFSPTNPNRAAYSDQEAINRHLDGIHAELHQIFDACLLKCEEAAKQAEEPGAKRTKCVA